MRRLRVNFQGGQGVLDSWSLTRGGRTWRFDCITQSLAPTHLSIIYWTYDLHTNTSTNLATFNLVLQESLETQLSKPDILTADLSKIEVGLLKQKENNYVI